MENDFSLVAITVSAAFAVHGLSLEKTGPASALTFPEEAAGTCGRLCAALAGLCPQPPAQLARAQPGSRSCTTAALSPARMWQEAAPAAHP